MQWARGLVKLAIELPREIHESETRLWCFLFEGNMAKPYKDEKNTKNLIQQC